MKLGVSPFLLQEELTRKVSQPMTSETCFLGSHN
jgi:hypothetical protein